MTFKRRVIVLPVVAALVIASVGGIGVVSLMRNRGDGHGSELALVFPLTVEQAIALLVGLTVAGCATVLLGTLMVRRSIGKRLAAFRVPLGSAPTAIPDRTGDELDRAATQLNELTAAVSALRSKQHSEDEVLAAKRFTDNIIQSMYDVLIVTDPGLTIVAVNRAACALLEYSELELVGRPIEELFKDETYGTGLPVREMLSNNVMRDHEMTYRTRSGRLVTALVSASTMRDNSGRPLAIITVGKDISARKQIERDLLEAKAAAEAASRAKSAFVANMSHEIRTPMTAILGYADLLTRPNQSNEEREQCVQTICRNGRHLLSIINDILDVSKIEAGKMTVETIAASPVQLVSDIAALMMVRASDKNLSFDVRYTGPIPAAIQTDPTRLRQVLMNLLGNAIKFTERGGVKLIVSLMEASGQAPSQLRFDIVDSGLGMSEKQVAALFKPFTQADASTTRKFGGTGLGLTISKRLASMLGGDLTVRSVPDNGSTFSLTVQTGDLTGVQMISNPTTLPLATTQQTTHETRFAGRVLLAEDGPDNRVLVSFYLRELGLEVTAVENGLLARDQALQAVRDGTPFDAILMDMQMPELDGYQATQQLRAAGYGRAIIALTAHAMGGDREKCIDAGCNDFAVKPIEREKLIAVLRKYLQEVQPEDSSTTSLDPAASPAPPVASGSNQLSSLLSKPGTARLVEKFVSRLDERMAAIRAAAAAQDRASLKTLAHQLKGAAGGYGYPQISEAAKALEQSVADELADLTKSVEALVDLCRSVRSSAQPQPAKA